MHPLELARSLQNNYLFHGLELDQIWRLAEVAKVETYEGGETVVRQFADDKDVLIILDGAARINTGSGELLAEAGPGSVLGEVSLVDHKPRSATVVAMGSCRVARFPFDELWATIITQPDLGLVLLRNVGRILAARLRSANVQLDVLIRAEAGV